MKAYSLPISALVFAIAAFVAAAFTPGGIALVLTLAVAWAACLVALATFFLYRAPARVKEITVENFSLWSDVGEPAAELLRFPAGEFSSALRLVRNDLQTLVSNSTLLSSRVSMLVGKPGFEEIKLGGLNLMTEGLLRDLERLVARTVSIASPGKLPDLLGPIESCASQADRIAKKLFEFGREKPEVIRVYSEPLRRGAERLSRDLRVAHANLAEYARTLAGPQAPSGG